MLTLSVIVGKSIHYFNGKHAIVDQKNSYTFPGILRIFMRPRACTGKNHKHFSTFFESVKKILSIFLLFIVPPLTVFKHV